MTEETLFNIPQRLNPLGYIINMLKTFVKIIKQSIFFIGYLFYKNSDIIYSKYFALSVFGIVLLIALISFINFRSFKYYVNEGTEEFIVTRGFFSKSKVVIKFANILQVNITQNILQKTLSLYSLTLDTAGTEKIEADLYALDGSQAVALKHLLLSKIHHQSKDQESIEETDLISKVGSKDVFVELPAKNILLVSLFSNYRQGLALFLAFLVSIFQQFKDAVDTFELDEEGVYTSSMREIILDSLYTLIPLVFVTLIAIPFVINLARYYFKYYNFSIVKNAKGNFSMLFGMFKQVNTIFNKDKIQLITFKQNKLLKRLGIGILSLKQLVADAAKADKTSIDIPGIAISDRDKVYALAFGESVFGNRKIIKPQIGLLINRMLKMLFVYIVVGILILNIDLDIDIYYFYPVILFLLLAHILYNYLFYKNYYMIYNDHFMIKRYGVWNEKEIIIPMDRVQGVEIAQTIFQKYACTANLDISTAAKKVSFRFFKEKDLNQIANYVLYVLEK